MFKDIHMAMAAGQAVRTVRVKRNASDGLVTLG